MYIRKNHLTINEDPEIFEIVSDDGTVIFFGTEEDMTEYLDTDDWECGDCVPNETN